VGEKRKENPISLSIFFLLCIKELLGFSLFHFLFNCNSHFSTLNDDWEEEMIDQKKVSGGILRN
jgi:hypothetical protein